MENKKAISDASPAISVNLVPKATCLTRYTYLPDSPDSPWDSRERVRERDRQLHKAVCPTLKKVG